METPDRWVILKVKQAEKDEFKVVLAGWNGSYTGSDSWKRSSPIKDIVEDDEKFTATTSSGNQYVLHKSRRGWTSMMGQVYNNMTSIAKEMDTELNVEEL